MVADIKSSLEHQSYQAFPIFSHALKKSGYKVSEKREGNVQRSEYNLWDTFIDSHMVHNHNVHTLFCIEMSIHTWVAESMDN